MRLVRVPPLLAGLLLVVAARSEVVIDIPMDQQINLGGGDAIYATGNGWIEFVSDGPEGWTRHHVNESGWYAFELDLELAGAGMVDMSGPGSTLELDCRYYQDNSNPYADAPIFVELNSANGGRGFGIVYQTGGGWQCDPIDHYPAWFHVTIVVNDLLADYDCDGSPNVSDGPEFDPAAVTRIHFFGTDWNHVPGSEDWIDVKDLHMVAGGQSLPPPGYSVTPVLFVPDLGSFPPGYQPTLAELEEDLANIDTAMGRIRRWYAGALGLTSSLRIAPVVYMPAEGGLGDYDIVWTDPELRYRDGIWLGNTWGLVLGEVSSRGYGPGSDGWPRMTVIFCKGAGGFAGGSQWYAENGGGMCMLGDWCLDSLADRVPGEWWDWWTGLELQTGAAGHEMGHTIGLPHPDALNPESGEQDYPYTIMGAWWDWPWYPGNPADPSWPLAGLHAWADNTYVSTVSDYQDVFLLDYRADWFAHPLADIDSDGQVDLRDFAAFQPCFGAAGTWMTDCDVADFNRDDEVQNADFEEFSLVMSGPAGD